MMSIGEFARWGQVSVRMLRHYDAEGLLAPEHVDPWSGRRHYSAAQFPRLHRIVALKELGLTLRQVEQVLVDKSGESLHALLADRIAGLEQELLEAQTRLSHARFRLRMIQSIESESTMEDREFVIKTVPAMTVTGRRATVAAQPQVAVVVEPLFDEVAASINRAGGCAETGVGIYWDDDAGLHMLASYVSDGAAVPDAETVPLEEIRAASTMHLGPMDTVAASWQALSLWCEQNGWTPYGACREVYLQAADPDDQSAWVVELQQPVMRG